MDHVTDTTADTDEIEEYRLRARQWLSQNLQQRRSLDEYRVTQYTPEVIAANRALQRTLFDGGYAGITWPKEYGGQVMPA